MKFKQTTAAFLLTSTCIGTPLLGLQSRQSPGSYYAITGPTGGVQARLEIRQLQQTGEMWNLFLLALTEFEALDQAQIDSYYQIAGIHGMPWYDWDGVSAITANGLRPQLGYCPHSQLLFATWHRPYMLLFEQKLQSIAINIAGRFTGDAKAKYQDAASKLRLPYWDWARAIPANEHVFPTALSDEKVQVTFPNNSVVQIDNPLFDYDFHPHDINQINGTGCRNVGGPLDNHVKICNDDVHTVRKATTTDRDVSNHTALELRFEQLLHPLRTGIFSVLSKWQPFDSFNANGNCGDPDSHFALEYVHDTIHVEMAPAHMVPPAVAAFDPVFWLHHSNVDRYLAIWQAIYPDTYVEQCKAETPTWTIQVDDVIDANSPLTPFHRNAAGDYWTSANCRNIEALNYTYPELANKPSNESLIATVISLYGGPDDGSPAKVRRQEATPVKSQAYLAEVQMPKDGKPYSVFLFLGAVGNNTADWLSATSFAGLLSTLGTESAKPGTGSVDITEFLEKKISTGETTTDKAVEYLKANLKWRIAFADTEIARASMPDLKVSLLSTDVEKATSKGQFDRWVGGFQNHGEVDA